jgi:ABC-type ATPase involved in cell division
LIGPSGTGKTTLSYGLLLDPCVKLVADDWHFFKFVNGTATGYASEKNTYIRADVASVWKEYKHLLKGAKLDNRGRAVVDVGRAIGKNKLEMDTEMHYIVLLQRDKTQPVTMELSAEEALRYLVRNDYCNPHTLQSNAWKQKVRKEAFFRLFKRCRVLLLNTIETPEQSLRRIKEFVGL